MDIRNSFNPELSSSYTTSVRFESHETERQQRFEASLRQHSIERDLENETPDTVIAFKYLARFRVQKMCYDQVDMQVLLGQIRFGNSPESTHGHQIHDVPASPQYL